MTLVPDESYTLRPIGVVRSPIARPEDAPMQGYDGGGFTGLRAMFCKCIRETTSAGRLRAGSSPDPRRGPTPWVSTG